MSAEEDLNSVLKLRTDPESCIQMKMENIVLIGMPGVGKSTIGVVLAKVLGYQFLDSDLLIQKQEKKKLYQIINEKGLAKVVVAIAKGKKEYDKPDSIKARDDKREMDRAFKR